MPVRKSADATSDLEYFDSPKWIRALRDGEAVVDSRRVRIVWLPGRVVPIFAFPRTDVVGGAEPVEGMEDYVTVAWDSVDEWLEEDERLYGHARDPFRRIDARRSSRHVVVSVDDVVLAESRRPVVLFETGWQPRFYLPAEDVRLDLLSPSPTRTTCAYKGVTRHFSYGEHADVAWVYPDPLDDAPAIEGLICFYDERVDVVVDGEPVRAQSEWSR